MGIRRARRNDDGLLLGRRPQGCLRLRECRRPKLWREIQHHWGHRLPRWVPDLAPVGSFKPNPFGLYDMLGNIFVLTADCWNDSYAGAPSDGSAWTAGDCTKIAARKAGFGNTRAWMFRAANREPKAHIVKRNRFGFRVALSLP